MSTEHHFLRAGDNTGTTPLRGLLPKSDVPTSRYGLFGVSAYVNKDGQIFPIRNVGGDIRCDGQKGKLTVYRLPMISYSARAKGSEAHPGRNYFETFSDLIVRSMKTLADEVMKFTMVNQGWARQGEREPISIDLWEENFADFMDQIYIHSQYELERWYTLKTWNPITRDVYEGWNAFRSMVGDGTGGRYERFMCGTFADDHGTDNFIPAQFHTESGAEIYITPPRNSQAGITRIYVNYGIWEVIMRCFGYGTKASALMFELLDNLYSNNKAVSVDALLSKLSEEGFNPCGYMQDHFTDWAAANPAMNKSAFYRGARLVWDLLSKMFILKIFELVRQSVGMEDLKVETDYTIFFRTMPDEQFKAQIEILQKKWAIDEIRVPTGSLNARTELLLLPIVRKSSLGYQVCGYTDANNTMKDQHDSSEYQGQPAVTFCDLKFEYDEDTVRASSGFKFEFLELHSIHNIQDEQILSLNKMTGEVESMDKESVALFGIVYPYSLHTIRPITVSMRFEERHWPLIYKWIIPRAPVVKVLSRLESSMYNQQSIYGPRKYLVNTSNLVKASTRGEFLSDSNEIAGRMFEAIVMALDKSHYKGRAVSTAVDIQREADDTISELIVKGVGDKYILSRKAVAAEEALIASEKARAEVELMKVGDLLHLGEWGI